MDIDICICTFRRAHLAETLGSIAALDVDAGWSVRVIVADNDDSPSAQEMVEGITGDFPFSLDYVHAPARNISIARNACLDAAKAQFVAFIDDDELVSEGWLLALIEEQARSGADVVLGPVRALYGEECPRWIVDGDFHATRPVWVNGKIISGYSCNVLMLREAPSVYGRRFRLDLGRSGGEDMMFFVAVYGAGGVISFAEDALVLEEVPSNRARLMWLLKRRFRFGQTYGLMLIEGRARSLFSRLRCALIAAAKVGFCFLVAPFGCLRKHRFYYWVLRGVMHAGVVARLLGGGTQELYGVEVSS